MDNSDVQLDPELAGQTPIIPRHTELETLFNEVNALQSRLKQVARELSSEASSTFSGQDVLQILLERGEQTVPQIARIRATSRQNIQILINRLKAQGCVELIDNPAHKKSPLVRLIDRGHAFLASAIKNQEKLRAALFSHFNESEVSEAIALLNRIRNLLNASPGSAPEAANGSTLQSPQKVVRRKKAAAISATPESTQGEDNELPVSLL